VVKNTNKVRFPIKSAELNEPPLPSETVNSGTLSPSVMRLLSGSGVSISSLMHENDTIDDINSMKIKSLFFIRFVLQGLKLIVFRITR
jgi:hypothetical protein